MRKVIVMLLIMAITGTAIAQDLGSSRDMPAKRMTNIQYTPPADGNRQGGDDAYSAVAIASLPYTNVGTTNGFFDDYDVACPYGGSTSPDVVYSYMPAADVAVAVDLCGSGYDTKVYILDSTLTPIACNDDFYFDAGCGVYVSFVEATLTGGETYFIVVDGYGGESGSYAISVDGFVPCVVACPADAVPEGEPAMYDGYADEYNSGCNGVMSNNFQVIDWTNDEDGVAPFDGCAFLCGNSGWHLSADFTGEERDTDWFVATALNSGTMEFTVESQYPCYLFQLTPSPMDCGLVAVGLQTTSDCGAPGTLSIPVVAGEVVYLWVGPTTYTGPVLEFPYSMTVCNNEFGTVSNEDMDWGQVKTLFK